MSELDQFKALYWTNTGGGFLARKISHISHGMLQVFFVICRLLFFAREQC